MKHFIAVNLLLVTALSISVSDSERIRDRQLFDFDWQFFNDDAQGADKPGFNASAWRNVDLPHDWSIEGPWDLTNPTGGAGGNYPAGIGWYRKQFTLPDSSSPDLPHLENVRFFSNPCF